MEELFDGINPIVVEPSGPVSLIGMVEGEVVTSGDFAAAIEQFQVPYAP